MIDPLIGMDLIYGWKVNEMKDCNQRGGIAFSMVLTGIKDLALIW